MIRRLLISMALATAAFNTLNGSAMSSSSDLNNRMWRALEQGSPKGWSDFEHLFFREMIPGHGGPYDDEYGEAEEVEPDINAEKHGMTPLLYAITNQFDDHWINLIVRMGADVNRQDEDSVYSPLTLAVSRKKPALVAFLIKMGADVNIAPAQGDMPIIIAVRSGNMEIVKILARKSTPHLLQRALEYAGTLQKPGLRDNVRRAIDEAKKEMAGEEKKVAAEEGESFAAPPGGIIGKSGQ